MSNHQKKADIAEFVGPLLKRLEQAKERVPENSEQKEIIDQISTEVVKAKDILGNREKLDWELAGYFGKIERQIDSWNDHNEPREKAPDLPQKPTIPEVGESSNTSYQMDKEVSKCQELVDLLSLDFLQSICVQSLLIFPENTELKKRLVIYWWGVLFEGYKENDWWIGQSWVYTDHSFESLFSDLADKKVLIPVDRRRNKVINSFTIEPILHKCFMTSDKYLRISSEKREEGTWRLLSCRKIKILLNLEQRYLNSKDIMDISSKHDDLRVIQLGSWRYTKTEIQETGSEETKSKDHIEVDQIDFLKKLGKKVRYLSLRGISGITELPESIGKLEDLMILDLRACHNLEKLPQKPRSTSIQKLIRWALPQERSWFDILMVLDISECYLLDHMPKWVCELYHLVVLKGFVVGSLGNKNQSCQLGDLSNLNNLRKLSIRIAPGILGPEVFRGFKSIESLRVLTIIWGANKHNKEIPTYSLPENIEKLDIRCYPEADASKLQNPEKLENLKRLYIRGGNLTEIPCHDNWKVEILRLRFLKKLVPTDFNEVTSSFKNLMYVEYVECSLPENFPDGGNSWHM